METNNSHQDTLAALQEEFPAFRIWLETTLTGPRYIARSRHLSQNPHTLITRDLTELKTALSAAKPPPPPAAATQPVPLPRRRSA